MKRVLWIYHGFECVMSSLFFFGNHFTGCGDFPVGRNGVIFFSHLLAPPRILLPNPAPVVRLYEGQYLQCSAIGTLPVYVSITDSTSYLFGNRTNSLDAMIMEEGNYTCVATNRYGIDKRVIPVIFKGTIFLWQD